MDQRFSQSQRQTQKLILAPQLRQFLSLLQLPVFELEQRIEQEITQNPVLEEVTPNAEEEPTSSTDSDADREVTSDEQIIQALESLAPNSDNTADPDAVPLRNPHEVQQQRDYQESVLTKQTTLADYLEWQLGFLDLTHKQNKIARYVIGNVNDDGRLVSTIDEIARHTKTTPDEVDSVLALVQQFDPPGVAARDLPEALLIQLKKLEADTTLAQSIVSEHFSLLQRKQMDTLARQLRTTSQKIKSAYLQITKLEPKPGRIFYYEQSNFVIPDARITLNEDENEPLSVEMRDERIPRLRINQMYRRLFRQKDLDPKTKTFLKEKIQAGLDLIRAIQQRKSTIQLISEELLRAQRPFFTKGFTHLKPLRLKDVADRVGIHESTVSRAIQGKYLDTPQGTIPYKSFFSSQLQTPGGESESQKSAMERLRQIIGEEDKKKPFSDSALVKRLEEDGVKIARRTVAKYRDLLKILPAHLRKER